MMMPKDAAMSDDEDVSWADDADDRANSHEGLHTHLHNSIESNERRVSSCSKLMFWGCLTGSHSSPVYTIHAIGGVYTHKWWGWLEKRGGPFAGATESKLCNRESKPIQEEEGEIVKKRVTLKKQIIIIMRDRGSWFSNGSHTHANLVRETHWKSIDAEGSKSRGTGPVFLASFCRRNSLIFFLAMNFFLFPSPFSISLTNIHLAALRE